MQRRIDALLDEADEAVTAGEWLAVGEKARAVLAIDVDNEDAQSFLKMADAAPAGSSIIPGDPERAGDTAKPNSHTQGAVSDPAAPADPESFAGGRYNVLRFLGEGGKKRVFLAHDELLDRDIAFSLIKTEGLDDVGRERIMREAQAMGRLSHQNIVSIYDIGEHVIASGASAAVVCTP